MKRPIIKSMVMAVALVFCACTDDNEPAPPATLPVNYANISGIWRLAEWNGEQMDDTRYLYMTIGRKADDQTGRRPLDIFQNIDSNKSRHLTSTYELILDEDLGIIIKGLYDHSSGFWNRDYIISGLSGDRMTWTVTDDSSDVSKYVRCDAIPEDILNGTRAL